MKKRAVNWTIDQELFNFISDVKTRNGLSQSAAAELLFGIVRDYFSDSQIDTEHSVRGVIDGRRKSGDN